MAIYVPTDWVDNVTPVNAANMDKLEAGVLAAERAENKGVASGYASLAADGKVPLAQLPPLSGGPGSVLTPGGLGSLLYTGSGPAAAWSDILKFKTDADGKLEWGSGSALDTNLYRAGANALKTDGEIQIGNLLYAAYASGAWGMVVGSPTHGFTLGGDTNLYRQGAGDLRTSGSFMTGGSLAAATEVYARLGSATQTEIGYHAGYSAIKFGPAADAAIYRQSAGLIRTDNQFAVMGGLWLKDNADPAVVTPSLYAAHHGISFIATANNQRVGIYGYAGGYIAQFAAKPYNADSLAAWDYGSNVRLTVNNDGALNWGPALDTNLYRASADNLATDDTLNVGASLVVDNAGVGNRIWFGNAWDTSMWRAGAGTLQIGATVWCGSLLALSGYVAANYSQPEQVVIGSGVGGGLAGITFGSASDTSLYRSVAGILRTGGEFYAKSFASEALPTDTGWVCFTKQTGATNWRFAFDAAGRHHWGDGVVGIDTNLYRHGADALATDDSFRTKNGTGERILLTGVGGNATILFGSAGDTNLYRYAQSVLKTDHMFIAANLGITALSAGATTGSIVAKIPVYDGTGALAGYLPVYNA